MQSQGFPKIAVTKHWPYAIHQKVVALSVNPWRTRESDKNMISRNYRLTWRPAWLLCRFIKARPLVIERALRSLFSGASTNVCDSHMAYLTLSLHPASSHPLGCEFFFFLELHVHSERFPWLQDLVTAYTTPADVIAWTNAVSLLPSSVN
jgi:hypothetical protein